MPTFFSDIVQSGFKCEGCPHTTKTRKAMKKHIYESRKDRNKSDKRNHR